VFKRIFSVVLMLGLVLSMLNSGALAKEKETNSFINNNRVKIHNKEFENLISLGFTQDEILNMDKEEFKLNKDLKGEVESISTNYIKVLEPSHENEPGAQSNELKALQDQSLEPVTIELDEDTYYQELADFEKKQEGISILASSHTTNTSYKRMTTTITKLTTKTYRLKNSVTWDKMPSNRKVDVTGVGVDTYWGPLAGTQYGKQNWTTYSICNGTQSGSATYTTSSNKWNPGTGGYSLKINLPDNDFGGGCASDTVKTLSSYMYFTVSEKQYINRIDAFGQYAHQESTISVEPSISLSGITFSVSPSSKFTIHPATFAQVYR
jgi:hypothetical protein